MIFFKYWNSFAVSESTDCNKNYESATVNPTPMAMVNFNYA